MSLLGIRSKLRKHDLPFGLGVDVGTGVVGPDPTGVCGTVSPTVNMGLNHVHQIVYVPKSGMRI